MKLSEIKLSQQGVLEGSLNEFAPPGDDGNDGFSEETLKMLAAQWWNGDQDPGVEKTLMAAGWEIGQDEGYDNGGVFVVQAGDINGHSYLSWPADELQGLAEGSLNELSSDLLQRAAGIAKQKASKANNQWDNPLMKDVEKHYDTLSQKFSNKAVKVGQKDAVKKIASPAVMRKMGMAESGRVDSPVSQAIITRILKQRTDLLMKYGPEQVGNAIDNVADWVNIGPDDEIGFTDVNEWVDKVARYLQTQAGEGLEEADNANPVSRRDMIAALHKAHGWGTAELNLSLIHI